MSLYSHFDDAQQEILRERARRVANAAREENTSNIREVLLARVQNERYMLPVEGVLAVYEDVVVTAIPCVPAFVAGLVNLRGHLVPVLDLASLLNVTRSPDQVAATIVVAATNDYQVGLLVDQANDVQAIAEEQILPVPITLELGHEAYLQGVTVEGIALLNLNAILSDPTLTVDQQLA